ncbi:TolC family protein [Chondromyces crocatus]|uniref:TolC family protein n=1 Tax=Chondromyces crocatus TaxID=52 RepID=A0A0K1EJU3_CHOCO|nr:TolC family protein [Chondromyces crocatus]AKT41125.1 uncharacterized protein CMC5_052860 [Chondromyces crocatus]
MGPLKCAAWLLLALGLPLAGCYTPFGASGSDHAIALYRDERARTALLQRHGVDGISAKARAEGRRPAPAVLTVDQAVTLAKDNSPRLIELTARAEAARVGIDAWRTHRNPELRLQQGRLDQYLNGQPRLGTALRFRPSRPGEADAATATARSEEVTAIAEARAEELTIEADIRWLFDEAALLEAEIEAADRVLEARRERARQMKARLEIAQATTLDDVMAELSAVEAEQGGFDRRARLEAVKGELLDRAGLSPSSTVRLVGGATRRWPPPDLPSEEALVEAALRNRVEVATAAAQIDATHALAFIEQRRRWPWFTFVEVGYQFAPSVETGRGWTFELALELPVFNTGRAGAEAAEVTHRAAKTALVAEVKLVTREVHAALLEVRAAEKLVTEFRRRAIPAAERADAAAQQALEARGISGVDALLTRERLASTEQKQTELMRRYVTGVDALRRAVGGRIPGESPEKSSEKSSTRGGPPDAP